MNRCNGSFENNPQIPLYISLILFYLPLPFLPLLRIRWRTMLQIKNLICSPFLFGKGEGILFLFIFSISFIFPMDLWLFVSKTLLESNAVCYYVCGKSFLLFIFYFLLLLFFIYECGFKSNCSKKMCLWVIWSHTHIYI